MYGLETIEGLNSQTNMSSTISIPNSTGTSIKKTWHDKTYQLSSTTFFKRQQERTLPTLAIVRALPSSSLVHLCFLIILQRKLIFLLLLPQLLVQQTSQPHGCVSRQNSLERSSSHSWRLTFTIYSLLCPMLSSLNNSSALCLG